MSSLITNENFSKICRCCIVNQGEMNVFEAHLEKASLSSIIFNFTNETISQADGLPKEICNSCAQLLINFHSFSKIFEEAQCHIKYMYEAFSNQIKTGNRINGSDTLNISNKGKMREKEIEKFLEVKESSDISGKKNYLNEETIINKEINEKFSKQKTVTDFEETLDGGINDICIIAINDEEMNEIHSEEAQEYTEDEQSFDQLELLDTNIDKKINEVDKKTVHLRRHTLNHQGKSHVCQYCGKEYVKKGGLTNHVQRKHEADTNDLNSLCFICGKLCTDSKSLTSHLNTHTDDKRKNLPHYCEQSQSLNTHDYMAHTISVRIPKHTKTRANKRRTSLQNRLGSSSNELKPEKPLVKNAGIKKKPIECPVCLKKINYYGIGQHVMIHTEMRPFKCKYCPKSYRYHQSFKMHMNVHLNLKPFICDICGQQFRHSTTLKVHRRIHTGEKPYSCTICSKTFRCASSLKKHGTVHTGERRYICIVCSKSYLCNSALKKHQRVTQHNLSTLAKEKAIHNGIAEINIKL